MKLWNFKATHSLSPAGLCLGVAGFAILLAAPLTTPQAQAQETKEKVTVDDTDRTYMLRLPQGYDPQKHYPLVILLHGMNQDTDDI